MNYRKSVGAADLRQRTMRRIGVVVEKFIAGYPMLVRMSALAGLQEYLLHHGFSLDILPEPVTASPEAVVPEYIRTSNHAALVIYSQSSTIDNRLAQLCDEHALPWVLIDGVPEQPNTMALDEYNAGSLAARHLLELGHRRVAYIGYDIERTAKILDGRGSDAGPLRGSQSPDSEGEAGSLTQFNSRPGFREHDPTIRRLKTMLSGPRSNGLKTTQKSDVTRYRGYQAAMASTGAPEMGFSWVPDTPSVALDRNRATDLEIPELRHRFLAYVQRERPTGLICYNDSFAWTAIQLLREAGYDVPQDVSVVGMNDLAATNFGTPALTTVTMHYSDLGLYAGQLLLSRLESVGSAVPGRVIVCSLHVRQSTRPPR